ncbi:hypothetical protein Taro_037730 [Colocasia esculenta]|uniref:Uncharacterized protein n=1 Tax=Colocasia esculenta TaxID=4460 RepID=A0A843WLK6_COLES|nr:hypothetical protein [Colocasia esculenta]
MIFRKISMKKKGEERIVMELDTICQAVCMYLLLHYALVLVKAKVPILLVLQEGSIRRAKSKFELKPAGSTESHWDRSIPVRLERSNSDPAELGRSTLKTGIFWGFQAESDPYLSI